MSSTATAAAPRAPSQRLTSLDQFRGYTMFGMLLVNFLGGYKAVCPYILRHHHDYCSYADTIMPQFLFAAGFAMRLSLGRRLEAGGKMPWGRAIRRVLGLALVAIAWYSFCSLGEIIEHFQVAKFIDKDHEDWLDIIFVLFKRELFQTLLHIAATSLWILPVITSSWTVRLWYAVGSGLLHVLISWWFNYHWVYADPSGVDGGPLGFLTWSIPALCGTLACDAVRASGVAAGGRIALCGIGLMLLGWTISIPTTLYNVPADQVEPLPPPKKPEPKGDSAPAAKEPRPAPKPHPKPNWWGPPLDPKKFPPDPVIPTMARVRSWDGTIVEPPFVPPPDHRHRHWNYWMMSQRGGTLSYPTFAAGFSLVIYALCLWLCDCLNLRLGIFRTLGTNSLAAYMLHDVSGWILDWQFPHLDHTESAWVALAGFGFSVLFVYGICRLFERLGWYIRV
jgi:predicted acyltransferase